MMPQSLICLLLAIGNHLDEWGRKFIYTLSFAVLSFLFVFVFGQNPAQFSRTARLMYLFNYKSVSGDTSHVYPTRPDNWHYYYFFLHMCISIVFLLCYKDYWKIWNFVIYCQRENQQCNTDGLIAFHDARVLTKMGLHWPLVTIDNHHQSLNYDQYK